MTDIGPHKNVFEYDGSFKCLTCGALWGAFIGNPPMPEQCKRNGEGLSMTDLIARLRAASRQYPPREPWWMYREDMAEAADALESQARELEAARKVVEAARKASANDGSNGHFDALQLYDAREELRDALATLDKVPHD